MAITERWRGFKQLPAAIKQKLEHLIPLFEQKGVILAYLFGSLAQSQYGQDVDLGILTQGESVFRLRAAITDWLGTERVDLVDLSQASPVLRFEILRTGQLLYAANEAICEQFELATLHLYRDTAPLRHQQEVYLKERMEAWLSESKASSSV